MAANVIEGIKEALAQLINEHETVGRAVTQLENLIGGMLGGTAPARRGRPPGKGKALTHQKHDGKPGKRRGRPPGSKNKPKKGVAKKRPGRRKLTPEQREAAGARLAKARAAKSARKTPAE